MSLKDKYKAWTDGFQAKHNFNIAWFIRYALGGTVTAAAEFASYFLLSAWHQPYLALVSLLPERFREAAAGETDLWAIVVSNVVSYVVNYFLSKYWVFHSPETKHRRDATLFVLSCAANLLVVTVSAKLMLAGLELLPLAGKLWSETIAPLAAKIGSNCVAFVVVLVFKRFVIWNDTSKY